MVLAGDPMQLGPVLRSKQAKTFGLDLSLLERLIYSDLYARDEKKFADHGNYDPLLASLSDYYLNFFAHHKVSGCPQHTENREFGSYFFPDYEITRYFAQTREKFYPCTFNIYRADEAFVNETSS